ncbi:uncharacterized protein LOC131216842 [Anopheles bellator]|uniref:uncharacterized protein LOC131216842 n=1 Tax=Anopheles bellator TaxID=139047 RepID=UPI0026479954|nr:uncharacterized protein LOC131216842 [Anopheles bellator]
MSFTDERGGSSTNNNSPLYPSTDRFMPLGFSTPQHQGGTSTETRNYYSVQPKHMLPRSRVIHKSNRYGQNRHQTHDRSGFSSHESNHHDEGGNGALNSETDRANYSRNWKSHQGRNQGYGGQQRHRQNNHHRHGKPGPYKKEDYFHPSMLEDPWEYLLRQTTERSEQNHSRNFATAESDADEEEITKCSGE